MDFKQVQVSLSHILIKHNEQEFGRKESGGVKTKTHGVN